MTIPPLGSYRTAPATVVSSPAKGEMTPGAPDAARSPALVRTLLAPQLTIEFDATSARFVQTCVDPESETVLWRYPHEGQIAFSRGINAYIDATRRRTFDLDANVVAVNS